MYGGIFASVQHLGSNMKEIIIIAANSDDPLTTDLSPVIDLTLHREQRASKLNQVPLLSGQIEQDPLAPQTGAAILHFADYFMSLPERIMSDNEDLLVDSSTRRRPLCSDERLAVILDANGCIVTEYFLVNAAMRLEPPRILGILVHMGFLDEGEYIIVEGTSPVNTPAWSIEDANRKELLIVCERLMLGTSGHPENNPNDAA